jgi:hypothetical protein
LWADSIFSLRGYQELVFFAGCLAVSFNKRKKSNKKIDPRAHPTTQDTYHHIQKWE